MNFIFIGSCKSIAQTFQTQFFKHSPPSESLKNQELCHSKWRLELNTKLKYADEVTRTSFNLSLCIVFEHTQFGESTLFVTLFVKWAVSCSLESIPSHGFLSQDWILFGLWTRYQSIQWNYLHATTFFSISINCSIGRFMAFFFKHHSCKM